MQQSAPTPGYMYLLTHPKLPAWFKVGRTYRLPHAIAKELYRTARPSTMEVAHARFFLDSMSVERATHRLLSQHGHHRKFFNAFLHAIQAAIQSLPIAPQPLAHRHPQVIPEWDYLWQARVGDADSWSADPGRREDKQKQGILETNDAPIARRTRGRHRWMRLSAERWTTWLRSWGNALSLTEWQQSLRETRERLPSFLWENWPELTRETLLIEKSMCARLPTERQSICVQSALAFRGWNQVPNGKENP